MSSRPLRVLHIVPNLAAGGAQQRIVDFAENHDRRGVHPRCCASPSHPELARETAEAARTRSRSAREAPVIVPPWEALNRAAQAAAETI